MVTAYAKTLTQVVDDTLRFCNDFKGTGADGVTWTWAEVKGRASQLLIDLVRKTGCLRATATIILAAGTSVYNLPSDCIRPLRFTFDGFDGTLVLPRTISELDLQGVELSTSGDPYYFMRDTLGPSQIAVYPKPQTAGDPATEEGNVIVTYVCAPAAWTTNGASPDAGIPEWIHKDLKYGLAEMILPMSDKPLPVQKLIRAKVKWAKAIIDLQGWIEHQGPMVGVEPI